MSSVRSYHVAQRRVREVVGVDDPEAFLVDDESTICADRACSASGLVLDYQPDRRATVMATQVLADLIRVMGNIEQDFVDALTRAQVQPDSEERHTSYGHQTFRTREC